MLTKYNFSNNDLDPAPAIVGKVEEIYHLVNAFIETIGLKLNKDTTSDFETIPALAENEMHSTYLGEDLLQCAVELYMAVRVADSDELYFAKMEQAVLAKVQAVKILELIDEIERSGKSKGPYLELIRSNIDSFKMLFKVWVTTFEPTKNMEDDWGIRITSTSSNKPII
jgi:hypothetical protein